MQIPAICDNWRITMESGSDHAKKILDRLNRDNCITSDITDDFFIQLASKSAPTDPEDAKNMAIGIVMNDPARKFVCQGGPIPSDSFDSLFRLETVSKLKYLITDFKFSHYGIRDKKIINRDDLSDDELSGIIDEHEDTINLGNLLGIVWVSDEDFVGAIDINELIDRLGLPHLKNEQRCLKVAYKREKVKNNLHLPRSFDGIDNPQFELVEDCSAEKGKTRPSSLPSEQGLPEAVHVECTVIPDIFAVESIK